jgi:hypothetical protein
MDMPSGLTAQDFVTIASGGVMALAAVFLVAVLLIRGGGVPTPTLVASIAVILIGALVQLGGRYLDLIAHARTRVSVSLIPEPSSFGLYFGANDGAPLRSRAKLWLATSSDKCIPDSGHYDDKEASCPRFSKLFEIRDVQDTIHVSVQDAMDEMRARVLKASAASSVCLAPPTRPTPNGTESPIGDDSHGEGDAT